MASFSWSSIEMECDFVPEKTQQFKEDSRPGSKADLGDAVHGRRAEGNAAVPGRRAGGNDAVPGRRPISDRVDTLADNNTKKVHHGSTRPTSDKGLEPYTLSSIGKSLNQAGELHSTRSTSEQGLEPYTQSSIWASLNPAGDLHSTRPYTPSSIGLNPAGYLHSTRPTSDKGLEPYTPSSIGASLNSAGYLLSTRPTSDKVLEPYTPSSIGASLNPAGYLHSTRPTLDKGLEPYTPSSIGASLNPAGYLHSTRPTSDKGLEPYTPSNNRASLNPAGYLHSTRPTLDKGLEPYTPSSIGLNPAGYLHSTRPALEKGLEPYTPSSIGSHLNPAGNLHWRKSTEERPIPEWLKPNPTMSVQGNPDKVLTVQGRPLHNVFIPSDSTPCAIEAICVLPDGKVLAADKFNKKVKLLNQQYQVVSHCGVISSARGMCLITPSEVAVAVTDEWYTHEVQFIKVTHSQLVPGRKFKLQHRCIGIAHHQGDLFIACGTVLHKYSLSGTLVCRLYQDVSGPHAVSRCAVSPTGDKLFIINWDQHKLLTLARNGTVLATFTDPALGGPHGVHVTPAGQVLVCGYWSNTILQVDKEGRWKLATLATGRDGVWYPLSVCYSSTTSSIIVGLQDDNILVLRVE